MTTIYYTGNRRWGFCIHYGIKVTWYEDDLFPKEGTETRIQILCWEICILKEKPYKI